MNERRSWLQKNSIEYAEEAIATAKLCFYNELGDTANSIAMGDKVSKILDNPVDRAWIGVDAIEIFYQEHDRQPEVVFRKGPSEPEFSCDVVKPLPKLYGEGNPICEPKWYDRL